MSEDLKKTKWFRKISEETFVTDVTVHTMKHIFIYRHFIYH